MYKKAVKLGLEFKTSSGIITVLQLAQCSKKFIGKVVRDLREEIKSSVGDDDLSFLDDDAKQVDPILELKFDIAKDLYTDKQNEERSKSEMLEIKKHNAKLDELIAEQEEKELRSLSVEQLRAMKR